MCRSNSPTLIRRALKKDPDHRYSRASEMAAEIQIVRSMLAGASHSALSGGTIVGGAALGGPLRTPSGSLVSQPQMPSSGRIAVPEPPSREDSLMTGAPMAGFDVPIRAAGDTTSGTAAAAADAAARRAGRRLPIAGLAGAAAFIAVLVVVVMTLRSGGGTPSSATPGPDGKASTAAGEPAATTTSAGARSGALPGTFSVVSTPAGARISVDGRETGQVTPAAIPVTAPFPKQLQLTLDGYEPLSVSLQEADVRTGGGEFALASRPEPVRVLHDWGLRRSKSCKARACCPAARHVTR